ncbi:hypothetical protein BDW67DRAFT_165019 [Aspergillus spinulosporus]
MSSIRDILNLIRNDCGQGRGANAINYINEMQDKTIHISTGHPQLKGLRPPNRPPGDLSGIVAG